MDSATVLPFTTILETAVPHVLLIVSPVTRINASFVVTII
jgi:hypothetical protein